MSSTTDETPQETTMDRPPFDPVALVMGVVFIVIAALALLDPAVARRVDLNVVWSLTFVAKRFMNGASFACSAFNTKFAMLTAYIPCNAMTHSPCPCWALLFPSVPG